MTKLSKYWTNNPEDTTDIYVKEGQKLHKKIIPISGIASTSHGEMLRIIINYIHELHNNGLGNYEVYLKDYKELIKEIETSDIKLSEESKEYKEILKTFCKKVEINETKSNNSIEEPEEEDCDCGGDEDCPECGGLGWYTDYDNYDNTTEKEEDFNINVLPIMKELKKEVNKLDKLTDEIIKYAYKKENNKPLKKTKVKNQKTKIKKM